MSTSPALRTITTVTREVEEAYQQPRLRISRRIAIYQADGKTLWSAIDNKRLVDGSISVSSDGEERRSVQLQLDNKDGALRHNPDDGFWYDKIIKLYRGLIFKARRRVSVAGINYARNPRLNTLTNVTTGGSATVSNSTDWALFGTTSLKVTAPASGGGTTAAYPYGITGALARMQIASGEDVTVSVYIHLDATQTGSLDTLARRLSIGWVNGAGTISYGWMNSAAAPNLPGTYRLSVRFTVPADMSNMFIRLINGAQTLSQVTYWTGLQIEKNVSTPSPFFDGEMLDTDSYDFAWSTQDVYTSYKYALGFQEMRFEVQIGEFMIDNIDTVRFPGQIAVNGRDYTKKLLLDQFAVDTAFASGAGLDATVKTIALNGGITKFKLTSGGARLGSQATFARGTSRWEAIKSMCEVLNIEVYFDREGYLVTRPYQDVSTASPSYVLSTKGSAANVVDFGKSSSDSNIFNHIVVIGTSEEETVTGYKFISVLENHDPDSPTAIERIGRRTFRQEADYLQTQADADALCRRLFRVKQLEDFNLSFSSVCLPWLEVGRVLQFKDPKENNSVPTRFLFSSFDIPLRLGPMTGTGKRIIDASGLLLVDFGAARDDAIGGS